MNNEIIWINPYRGSIDQFEETTNEAIHFLTFGTLFTYWLWGVPGLIIYLVFLFI
ncbi:hypothetical protein JCM31598_38040 [Desulfonatronum parangueonense]